jgi:hypothetical protein
MTGKLRVTEWGERNARHFLPPLAVTALTEPSHRADAAEWNLPYAELPGTRRVPRGSMAPIRSLATASA